MPLQRRVPKFGFRNPFRAEYKAVNLDTLQELAEKLKSESIDVDLLVKNGTVGKHDRVKVLGRGELKSKLKVSAHAFSASAKESIEQSGGTVTVL